MTSALYLDGDPVQYLDDDAVRVSLEFPWDTRAQHRCAACGGDLAETTDGYQTDDPDGDLCPGYDPDDHEDHDDPDHDDHDHDHDESDGSADRGDPDGSADHGDPDGGRPGYGKGPHVPERVPLSWVNSAAIDADDKDDSVTVSISVGDPRGAFTFTVRRIPDDAESDLAGRLLMHLPYPGHPLPHEPLTEHHPGIYLIG